MDKIASKQFIQTKKPDSTILRISFAYLSIATQFSLDCCLIILRLLFNHL